ncbi:facilitated trehalose transporter Tret1-like [Pectinophora gossypiella]|uniref:facilitated trehalose transporter Tret1-like n=1 Tax=Pectinophora gossypiella TaxID=13191 RepID=UPI00214F13B4|nr:facilitated trehalose transporter Tret1-like [Pectinophora gossypiella]
MAQSKTTFTPFLKQCYVTAGVCIDVIGHGCIVGYPAILLPQLHEERSIPLTEDEGSWIASVLGIAMLIGIFLTPPAMGRLGRKAAHYIVIMSLLAAWFIFARASTVTELLLARILQGLSFGMFTTLRSVVIGEYTSPKNRGAFLTTISLAQGFGIMLVHLIGSFVHWKITALICACFSFVSLIMTIYSPESPSWLADRGRYDECREVFRWLRGNDEEQELAEMIEARLALKKPTNKENRLKTVGTIILKKEFFKPCLIMLHMYIVMSFSGSMTIAAYSTTIISKLTGPGTDPHMWMVALDTQRLVSNTIAIYIINRVRRRTMVFATLGLNIVSHIAIAGYVFSKYHGYLYYDAKWIAGVLLLSHYLSIAIGMVPLPAVIAGEVFPLAYRSIGGSISVAFYAAFMFLALKTFTGLVDSIELYGTYVVYAALLTYTLVAIWWLMPETKGKTLQEIENEFRGEVKREHEMMPLRSDVEMSCMKS